jgi:hypothetical protein
VVAIDAALRPDEPNEELGYTPRPAFADYEKEL